MQDLNLKCQELFAAYAPNDIDLNKPCVPHIIAVASKYASKLNSPIVCTALEVNCIRKKVEKEMEKTDGLVTKLTNYEVQVYTLFI